MSVTLNMFLDTRRIKKKSNTYPVKVRATFDRKSQEYQTIFDLSQEEYNKLSASRVNERIQEIRRNLKEIEWNAGKVARELDPFSFEDFEKYYILGIKY